MTTVNQTQKYINDEDFPTLGAMAPKKGKRKGKMISPIGFVSRIDEETLKASQWQNRLWQNRRSATYEERGPEERGPEERGPEEREPEGRGPCEDPQRASAYEQLQDKDAMSKRLTKTRICWSVEKGVKCPHGHGKCQFAHSLDELRMAPCLFGTRCRFVTWKDGMYLKSGERYCNYMHPDETRENYLERIGLDKFKPKVFKIPPPPPGPPPPLIPPPPTGPPPPRTPRIKVTYLVPRQVILREREKSTSGVRERPSAVNKLKKDDDEELVTTGAHYSVPQGMAVATLEAALESGEKVITITIIDLD